MADKAFSFTFDLDRDELSYRPGDSVEGALRIDVVSDCSCKRLLIALGWRTESDGREDDERVGELKLGPLEWEAGEVHSFDFAFEMPNGPVSYAGKVVSLLWEFSVEAEMANDKTRRAKLGVALEPLATLKETPANYRGGPIERAAEHHLGPGEAEKPIPAWTGVVLVAGGTALLGWFAQDFQGEMSAKTLFGLFAIALVSYGGGYVILRNHLARQALGKVDVEVQPEVAMRGQSVAVKIAITPKRAASIQRVALHLVGREHARSPGGSSSTSYSHELHHETTVIDEQLRKLAAGERFEVEGKVALPPDAAPTFRSEHNRVSWTVVAHIDVPRWPDLEHEHEIVVQPS